MILALWLATPSGESVHDAIDRRLTVEVVCQTRLDCDSSAPVAHAAGAIEVLRPFCRNRRLTIRTHELGRDAKTVEIAEPRQPLGFRRWLIDHRRAFLPIDAANHKPDVAPRGDEGSSTLEVGCRVNAGPRPDWADVIDVAARFCDLHNSPP